MTRRTITILIAITILGAPLIGALSNTPHDDAGTGEDAPDDPDRALNLTPGSYIGNLTPGYHANEEEEDHESYDHDNVTRDQDWYRAVYEEETPIACTEVHFSTDDKPHNETRTHLNQPALDRAWINATTNATGTTLAMAGPDATGAVFGLKALDPPRVTPYTLEFNVTTLQQAEGAGHEETVPGPCFGDALTPGDVHTWDFEAQEGDFLFLSFGTEQDRTDWLTLTAPNGTQAGSITSEDDIGLGAKTLNATGTWTLTAEAPPIIALLSGQSNYLIGFTLLSEIAIAGPNDDDDDEDPRRPCRPHCM